MALQFGHTKLKDLCERKIKDILKSAEFLEFDRKMLEQILRIDSMKCGEFEVLTALMAWAETAVQRKKFYIDDIDTQELRQELGDLLYLVRFRSIPWADLSSFIQFYDGFFAADEVEQIIQIHENEHFHSDKFENKIRSGTIENATDLSLAGEKENKSAPSILKLVKSSSSCNVEDIDMTKNLLPESRMQNIASNSGGGGGGSSSSVKRPLKQPDDDVKKKQIKRNPNVTTNARFGLIECNRFKSYVMTKHYVKSQEITRFVVDKPRLQLAGFECALIMSKYLAFFYLSIYSLSFLWEYSFIFYALGNAKTSLPSKVSVFKIEEPNIPAIFSVDTTLSAQKDIHNHLPTPIVIESGLQYEIHLEQDATNEHYTQIALEKELELKDGIIIRILDTGTGKFDDSKFDLVTKLFFQYLPKNQDDIDTNQIKNHIYPFVSTVNSVLLEIFFYVVLQKKSE